LRSRGRRQLAGDLPAVRLSRDIQRTLFPFLTPVGGDDRQGGDIVHQALILLLPGNHPSHSTLRIMNIADVTGYDMDVEMKDGLPRRAADIDADIEATRLEPLTDYLPRSFQQLPQREFLLCIGMKVIRNMPEGNQEHVPSSDRVAVPSPVTKVVEYHDLLVSRLTKQAIFSWHAVNHLVVELLWPKRCYHSLGVFQFVGSSF
jgi:hypothetical protein